MRILGSCIFSIIIFLSCEYQPYQQGSRLYKFHCENCHMPDGSGLGAEIPPLSNSDYLVNHFDELPCIIRNGLSKPIIVNGQSYQTAMAGIPDLTEYEVSNLINYINHKWAHQNNVMNINQMRSKLENCQ